MTWEKVKLGDCCISISDGDHQAPPKSREGIPFITIANIDQFNKIDFTNTMHVPKDYFDSLDSKRKPHVGDIIYSVVGSFGIPVYIKNDDMFTFQRHIAILKCKENINSRFLYYVMKSRTFYHQADSVAIGSAQKTITLSALRDMEVHLPERKVQNKIASILSAYDDLIENNRRQIKLLEEAAERLYKEWFVKRNINSCIHGVLTGNLKLTPKKLSSIIQFSNGYAFRSKTFTTKGHYKIVTIKNVQDSYFEGSDVDYISRIPSAMPNHCILKEGDILLSLTGNVGRVCVVVGKDYLLNQRVGKVCTAYPAFSYYFLKSNEIQTKMVQLANGSAQQNLSTKSIEQMIVNLPNEEYICTFEGIVQPFLNQQIRLSYDNQLLQEARDRLLPKLMSGEVEV
ncbi:restriction endonuclease subunit S [uncultured Dialister sp.]|uniref:restriction endonuclease subunit S n=1 Tax=uncultured Dialister sp. TaxID=278064 RepID=UPI00265898EE|nr:restriction endonuclease subunit S [uncultured Dialister sp.]